MRDLTVLSQLTAHLNGWSDLRARVATEADWPSVHVARVSSGNGAELWQCVHDHWTGQLFTDELGGEPIATILTTIGQDASASEAADGIKAIYRMLRTERDEPA
jgi:hypothetical protein